MPNDGTAILKKMLERLMAGLLNGPAMNCRPHNSRQRVDFLNLAKFADIDPSAALHKLLGEDASVSFTARVPQPKAVEDDDTELPPVVEPKRQAWLEQQSILTKLRVISEDARTYEQDTGVHILSVGFPLLRLPPGALGNKTLGRRVVAPIAFIPVSVTIRRGAKTIVEIACRGEGVDRVTPNAALMAWLDQLQKQTTPEMFEDAEGEKPWHEIGELVRTVARRLDMPVLPPFDVADENFVPMREQLALQPAPKSDDDSTEPQILPVAILGLYPMANQGLINDMKALSDGEPCAGPIESFLRVSASFYESDAPATPQSADPTMRELPKQTRKLHEERLVSQADPCQARAVTMARTSKGLVVHGPPGTGKSQTITNVIGDHLARGERVLFVCEKRTALDVVAHRLNHLGLDELVAVVHDPQRDQRDLYRAIRTQIEELADVKLQPGADKSLAQVDEELTKLHSALGDYRKSLMDAPTDGEASLHDLMGQWLSLPESKWKFDSALSRLALRDYESQATSLRETFVRAKECDYATNPWRGRTTNDLQTFLRRSMSEFRQSMKSLVDLATRADATANESVPPFVEGTSATDQGKRRAALADRIEQTNSCTPLDCRAPWATKSSAVRGKARQRLSEVEPLVARFDRPLDVELLAAARARNLDVPTVLKQLAPLLAYLEIANKWHAFIQFGRKSAASAVLREYGLTLSPDNAARVKTFLEGMKDRLIVWQVQNELGILPAGASMPPDDLMVSATQTHAAVLQLLLDVEADPQLAPLISRVSAALTDPAAAEELIAGLRRSLERGVAIDALLAPLDSEVVFDRNWPRDLRKRLFAGERIADELAAMNASIDSVENVIRVGDGAAKLPPSLGATVGMLLEDGASPDEALGAIRREVLAGEISRRLESDPQLQRLDERALQTAFERYRQLDAHKKTLVRDSIQHRWRSVQKSRLLAQTGSRLNSAGAALKQRFIMTGQRAMRLRKVIEIGRQIEDGDPLFDLRPAWMASPETVAQLFPRTAVFDVVIFDEASQCRLEEALPVLLRAKRLVIAGDPQQLPPTRFFESAVVASDDEDDVENEQALFESQQSHTEDLLAAALNLQVDEAYLDVHYRSRNSDLIEFSNQHFYNKRLQTIPGHPRNLTRYAPLRLDPVKGVYEAGENPIEADRVVQVVRELLHRADPPSIGVACFNVAQRDLILEKLEDLAAEDGGFAKRYQESRTRIGKDSFEGLFVKNLENVQGDERDHIIISTTYGPDKKGKFYKRFGPLLRGGGRRLNVLVTRAREEVHLVSSIPAAAYRSMPPVPPGMVASGGWLLFAYLHFAEKLAESYATTNRVLDQSGNEHAGQVEVRPTERPSTFAQALAHRIAQRNGLGGQVHWGNDGFCVDVALNHPQRIEDVTVGVLCDATRFDQAQDMVEWDIFRTAVHESQGWTLHRIWTPHFFRDPTRHLNAIAAKVKSYLEAEPPADSIAVERT